MATTFGYGPRYLHSTGQFHKGGPPEGRFLQLVHEADDDLAILWRSVGAEEYFLVRLEARPATLVKRIIEREPPSWSGLSGLVAHAQRLAVSMRALRGVDLVLSTEGERPEDVAWRIRAARPDQRARDGAGSERPARLSDTAPRRRLTPAVAVLAHAPAATNTQSPPHAIGCSAEVQATSSQGELRNEVNAGAALD